MASFLIGTIKSFSVLSRPTGLTRSNSDVNASAVALLSFLLLLNMMQVRIKISSSASACLEPVLS